MGTCKKRELQREQSAQNYENIRQGNEDERLEGEGTIRASQTNDRESRKAVFLSTEGSGVMEKQLGPQALCPLIKLSDW